MATKGQLIAQAQAVEAEYRARMVEIAIIQRGLDAEAAVRFADECLERQRQAHTVEAMRRAAARKKK